MASAHDRHHQDVSLGFIDSSNLHCFVGVRHFDVARQLSSSDGPDNSLLSAAQRRHIHVSATRTVRNWPGCSTCTTDAACISIASRS